MNSKKTEVYRQKKAEIRNRRARSRQEEKDRRHHGSVTPRKKLSLLELLARKKGKRRESIVFPEHFSIIDNPAESIRCLNAFKSALLSGTPLYLNAEGVRTITIDTLLSVLAQMNAQKTKKLLYSVGGNFPRSEPAQTTFRDSGFLDYVNSKTNAFPESRDIIQIKAGSLADPDIAKQLCDFSIQKLKMSKIQTSGLYNIVIEIIINSVMHAYEHEFKYNRWYCYAQYDREKDEIGFTMLDTGLGIPETVRKNHGERIIKSVANLARGMGATASPLVDAELIVSALRGEFRTKTGESFRGKGLPTVREFAESGYIENLTIVSSSGYVSYDPQGSKLLALSEPLVGTLFFWKMRNRGVQ